METKIRIEYTFNSLEELVEFLKKTGKIDGGKIKKDGTDIQKVLKEMNPNSIPHGDDDQGEQEKPDVNSDPKI